MSVLSVVLPAYNEELMIAKACRILREVLSEAGISYELVLVNDGSTDNTWKEIQKAAQKDNNITGVCFSRNFGKESAISAGLNAAAGDVVAVMDCDLQHPPEKLIEMYHLWEQGYEVIEGVKSDRGRESRFHRQASGLFYRLMSRAVKIDMQNTSDFKMLDRKAVNSILSMPERTTFFRATSGWVGFKTTTVKYEVQEREAGYSKWSTWSLFKYAFANITSFTTAPLQFITAIGMLCFVCSLILCIYTFVQYFAGHAVEGYSTLLVVMLFIGSAVMVSLGIIGYYIAKIYNEVKHRPRYLVSEMLKSSHQKQ